MLEQAVAALGTIETALAISQALGVLGVARRFAVRGREQPVRVEVAVEIRLRIERADSAEKGGDTR